MFDYEIDEAMEQLEDEIGDIAEWKKEHRAAHARHVATYRARHPEQTREQWRKDSAKFRERHPERAKEIVKNSYQKNKERWKLIREAEKREIENQQKIREAEIALLKANGMEVEE